VQKITIDDKLQQVVVRISMDASMNQALRTGTRFWIEEPSIEAGGVGGLLSGTYIGIAPGGGDQTREFKGQEYAPVLTPPEVRKTLILETHALSPVGVGSPVQFHGIRVGRVLGAEYDEQRRFTAVHAFVVQRFADHVRQGTRFWRSGGLNVSLSGGGLSMGSGGIAALLSAPIQFDTPEVLPGAPVSNNTRFELYDSEISVQSAASGPDLTYVTYFPGTVHGLTAGTTVQMKGVQVGRVSDVRLRYVPESASLETPVTIEIDPRLLQFPVNDSTTPQQLRAQMNDALSKLVWKGMRAMISSSLVLPGASGVSLEMIGRPGTARLVLAHDPPIIPAWQGGNGIEGALGAINQIAARIQSLPIEEIAGHLRSTVQRIDSLVHDPALDQSLQRLNRSLADVEKIAATTRENVGPIVESLRNAATSAEQAANSAQRLIRSSQRQDYDLGLLIKELTRAAESVRALASYLEEHPDSLLKGRPK
jgi:paraquat-inducible protein B